MQIKDLARLTNVSETNIRYYESIELLPPPRRKSNGYREYDETDVERVKLVAGSRTLDLSLDDIAEILAMRDQGVAPCRFVLELLDKKADEIRQRIADLQRLESELRSLHELGLNFPTDDVDGKNCVCHLVSEKA